MNLLDKLNRIAKNELQREVKFTNTNEYLELEIDDTVFKMYITPNNVEEAEERFFWYIVENLLYNFKTKR